MIYLIIKNLKKNAQCTIIQKFPLKWFYVTYNTTEALEAKLIFEVQVNWCPRKLFVLVGVSRGARNPEVSVRVQLQRSLKQ